MTYSSLMIHMDLGVDNAAVLTAASFLTKTFSSRAIGVAACSSLPLFTGDAYVSGEIIERDRAETGKMFEETERLFKESLRATGAETHWREIYSLTSISETLASEARSADVIVIAPNGPSAGFDPSRRVNVGELALNAGRPLLVVPPAFATPDLSHAVLLWKDSREARRAAADAIPLLKLARRVSVVEFAPEDQLESSRRRLHEVSHWLKAHGISAAASVRPDEGDATMQIGSYIAEQKVGLVVAGAYGHTRMREWALGGVTRDFLVKAPCLSLISH